MTRTGSLGRSGLLCGSARYG